MEMTLTNNVNPNQRLQYVSFDLGLLCLPKTFEDILMQWVNL